MKIQKNQRMKQIQNKINNIKLQQPKGNRNKTTDNETESRNISTFEQIFGIWQIVTIDPYYLTWLIPITGLLLSVFALWRLDPKDTKRMFTEVKEKMF